MSVTPESPTAGLWNGISYSANSDIPSPGASKERQGGMEPMGALEWGLASKSPPAHPPPGQIGHWFRRP